MELADLVAALRKRWFVLVVLAAVGAGVGYYQYAQETPAYRATAKVWVSPTRGDTTAEWVQGQTFTQNLIASIAALATTPAVLDPVVDDLGLQTSAKALAGSVRADSPLDLMFVEISATNRDPEVAAEIANAVATELSSTVQDITPRTEKGDPSVALTVVSAATPAGTPFSPSLKRSVGVPAAAGLLLGFVIAVLWSRLDTRVRSPRDFPGSPERPLLGSVPFDRGLRSEGPAAFALRPRGALAESYRRIHTNLQFVTASTRSRVVVVTSSVPGEGKSTTALALAMAIAEKRQRVLLVDADLRRPSVARMVGIEGAAGLSTVLVGEATIEDVVQVWGPAGLHVMPAGQLPPNPSQLIDSAAMASFLAAASAMYDVVVLDTPPMLALTDAAVLAKRADGAVVVAGCRRVRRQQLAETLRQLDAIDVAVLGLVANGVREKSHDRLYTYEDRPRRWARRRRPQVVLAAQAPHAPAAVGEGAAPAAQAAAVPDHASPTADVPTPAGPATEPWPPRTGGEHAHASDRDESLEGAGQREEARTGVHSHASVGNGDDSGREQD